MIQPLKVFVYFNLRKKVFSVKALNGEAKGLVVKHSSNLILKNVLFKVSQVGRNRVLAQKRKNVHAGVVGELVTNEIFEELILTHNIREVTYNPYKLPYFYDKITGDKVESSKIATMTVQKGYPSIFIAD